MISYVRRMLRLKFYVLISGLLIKYKCQNVGYIIQILNKFSWRKYLAIGWWWNIATVSRDLLRSITLNFMCFITGYVISRLVASFVFVQVTHKRALSLYYIYCLVPNLSISCHKLANRGFHGFKSICRAKFIHGQNLLRIYHCNPENSTLKILILLFHVSWLLKEHTLIFSTIFLHSKPNLQPFVWKKFILWLCHPENSTSTPKSWAHFSIRIHINLLCTQSNSPISYAANTLIPGAHRRMTLNDARNPENSTRINFFFFTMGVTHGLSHHSKISIKMISLIEC